ncbi:hypothetical protein GCM10010219_24700 [Streptomyces netropsis]|nr:hypothetical protein GCM10010219_24700 [Streptomyces netropsis]
MRGRWAVRRPPPRLTPRGHGGRPRHEEYGRLAGSPRTPERAASGACERKTEAALVPGALGRLRPGGELPGHPGCRKPAKIHRTGSRRLAPMRGNEPLIAG